MPPRHPRSVDCGQRESRSASQLRLTVRRRVASWLGSEHLTRTHEPPSRILQPPQIRKYHLRASLGPQWQASRAPSRLRSSSACSTSPSGPVLASPVWIGTSSRRTMTSYEQRAWLVDGGADRRRACCSTSRTSRRARARRRSSRVASLAKLESSTSQESPKISPAVSSSGPSAFAASSCRTSRSSLQAHSFTRAWPVSPVKSQMMYYPDRSKLALDCRKLVIDSDILPTPPSEQSRPCPFTRLDTLLVRRSWEVDGYTLLSIASASQRTLRTLEAKINDGTDAADWAPAFNLLAPTITSLSYSAYGYPNFDARLACCASLEHLDVEYSQDLPIVAALLSKPLLRLSLYGYKTPAGLTELQARHILLAFEMGNESFRPPSKPHCSPPRIRRHHRYLCNPRPAGADRRV